MFRGFLSIQKHKINKKLDKDCVTIGLMMSYLYLMAYNLLYRAWLACFAEIQLSIEYYVIYALWIYLR